MYGYWNGYKQRWTGERLIFTAHKVPEIVKWNWFLSSWNVEFTKPRIKNTITHIPDLMYPYFQKVIDLLKF